MILKRFDEIKKGVECCISGSCAPECPYDDPIDCGFGQSMIEDAHALIKQLESKLNQAVEDIRMLGRTGEFICPVCAHYNHGEGTKGECIKCLTGDGFRWRGMKEDDK